ncbi:MAG: alanine--tRNA ligase [Candidatus Thermoplasmatota archaeon]
MIDALLKKECDLAFFHKNGFVRKKCSSCGSYFWTLDQTAEKCGDQPCVPFSFITKPLTRKKLSLSEVRHHFLTFFEENNHQRIRYPETGERCPVIARWRSDIYLTIASIADFQPHVTSGEVPPPANPLVISQPCIRLNDLDEVGYSGRHLTTFEMMGHHAFNKNTDEIYWKEETVSYCDEFFRTRIGIPREYINYKEHLWIGGGNAGPCIEVLAGGLEIATLVFMNMKEDPQGTIVLEGKKYTQNPLNIVDTGYGLERISWFTQGTPTVYDTVFPEVIRFIQNQTKYAHEKPSIYALADHTKCLAFMLGDGIVPSNVKAGYLARLIIRRSLRFLEKLNISLPLKELVDLQLTLLQSDFPSLITRKKQIDEILDIETKRFSDTRQKGEGLVKRLLKEKKTLDTTALVRLYDTHGMPPDIVKNIAQTEGIHIDIPANFDSMIAELHSHETEEETTVETAEQLPETHLLYYEDHYMKEFDATVMWAQPNQDGTLVVLDQTAFYPEGGGQPSDTGVFIINGTTIPVVSAQKKGKAVIHTVRGGLPVGTLVHGKINWDARYALMKHHTGTHVVNAALRTLFGEHIWQAGSQLGTEEARFDFSHYKPITDDELKEIERIANMFIQKGASVEKKVMLRNDAEQTYGFRLYQGGVPPGNEIRVLNIPGIDVEACGGTHLNNIKEIEKIKILKAERIQDGVNRIIFAAGRAADAQRQQDDALFERIITMCKHSFHVTNHSDKTEQLRASAKVFSVPVDQLEKTIQRFLSDTNISKRNTVETLVDACTLLFELWKEQQKEGRKIPVDEIKKIYATAEQIPGTDIKVIATSSTYDATIVATTLIKETNYIVHIYDGKKICSAVSENISFDLRDIAPELGKILGGSGGGKPALTQSGGPKKENVQQALRVAKELTKEKVVSQQK